MENKLLKKEEYKKRILSFMLYKGYVEGEKEVLEEDLFEEMNDIGWFEIPMQRIHFLLKQKGLLNTPGGKNGNKK